MYPSVDREPLILLVDDDPDILEVMSLTLETVGYRTLTAQNGRAALELLRGSPLPDLILLDLMMPVMDGWEMRAELLRDPRLASIPVVVLTGNRVALDGPDLRVSQTLFKPVSVDTLLGTVAKYAEPRPEQRA